MKTKKLKNLVKKAKDGLVWEVREQEQAAGPLRIFSDPVARVHTIFLPTDLPEGGPSQELLYLHELGHALLCERAHPFFSTGFPVAGLEKEQFPAVAPVLSAACDWFVGHWMTDFCRDVALDELRKEYEATARLMEKGEMPGVDKFFVAVLIIAQSIKYLKVQVECEGFLGAAVKTFLAVPPEKPTARKMEELVNALLALGAPYRCRIISGEDQDLLEFYRVS